MKQFIRILSVGLIAAFPLISRPVYAASASLYLSPASGTVSQGSTITVSVRESSTESVNGVQANLTYPSNLLDFVGIGSSSAFSIVAQNSGGGGSVKIGRGALPAVSGNQLVATVTFRAKTSSGTAKISIASGSEVVSASSNKNIMTSSTGGNYTLRAPVSPSPTPPSPSAPVDKIPPTIKSVGSTDIKINRATITWITSEPSTSEVHYGPTDAYGLTAVSKKMVTAHKAVLSSAILTPGTEYHFMVKSVDPSGNAASSSDATFRTLGANLLVKVVNQDNQPVSGAKVTLGDRTGTTKENGEITLEGLPPGNLVGTIDHKGKKTVIETEITKVDPAGTPQPVTFKIETAGLSPWIIIVPLLGLLAAAAVLARRNWSTVGKHFGSILPGKGKGHPISSTPPSATPTPQSPEPSVIRPTQPPHSSEK